MSTQTTGVVTELKCNVGTIRVDDSVGYTVSNGAKKFMRVTGFGTQKSTGKKVFFGPRGQAGNLPWGYIEDVFRIVPRSVDKEEDWGDAINNPVPKITW